MAINTKNRKLRIILAASIWLALFLPAGTYALVLINDCTSVPLAVAGETYRLTQNVGAAGTCFDILANNITLDGQGYMVNYSQSATGYAVNATGKNNIVIKNLNIVQGNADAIEAHGIYWNGTSNSTISNTRITLKGGLSHGIYLYSSNSNNLSNNNITSPGDGSNGMRLEESHNNTLSGNAITESGAWANWWDYSWKRRSKIIINGSASDLVNYQALINLTNSALATDNFDFSKANPAGNDARLTWVNTTSGQEQSIPFWIERWESSGIRGNATLWAKIPNVTASSNTTIYMYYGNPSAPSASNGTGTFEFFDDFSGGLGKWTSGWSNFACQIIESQRFVLCGAGSYLSGKGTYSNSAFSRPVIIEWLEQTTQTNMINEAGYGPIPTSWGSGAVFRKDGDGTKKGQVPAAGTLGSMPQTTNAEKYKLVVKPSSGYRFYSDDALLGETDVGADTSWRITWLAYYTFPKTYFDDVRVRKYAAYEPNTLSVAHSVGGPAAGIYLLSSNSNNIGGGSIISRNNYDYRIKNSTANTFISTNFTARRSIYLADTTSGFNYNNQSGGTIWLKTNVTSPGQIDRTLALWSQNEMKWNDSGNSVANYELSGLAPSAEYDIYNSSGGVNTLRTQNASAFGIIAFPVFLNGNTEVWLKSHPDTTATLPPQSMWFEYPAGKKEIIVPLGKTRTIIVNVQNNGAEEKTIPVHIGSREDIRNWIWFSGHKTDESRKDLNVTLGPNESIALAIHILAAKAGRYTLDVGPDSDYNNRHDSMPVSIIQESRTFLSSAPDISWAGVLLTLALGAVLARKKKG